ncbi:hypothetical protein Fcan01_25276 [Folsomia candida]|uniref:Uncharacterized protein n=1 Tax=Folsomia candida TaxID=158441 RepID=A0A226D2N2_FOLCA|nr:hypothetical protein Fcan01_25276 [Folsomia candida]
MASSMASSLASTFAKPNPATDLAYGSAMAMASSLARVWQALWLSLTLPQTLPMAVPWQWQALWQAVWQALWLSLTLPQTLHMAVLAAFELLHAVKMAKTLAIVILIIAMIGCGFDVSLALVKARWCQYCVAFFNSLVNEYNDIQIAARIGKQAKRWNQFIRTFTIFLLGCLTLPILFAIFQAYLTMEGRFSFILYTGANSTCRLDTHLACKFILFILTGSLYFFIAFHVSASVAGEVVKAAVVLNMVIGAMRNLTMLNFNFHTIQMYQRICIVLKVVEPMTTLIAAILLLTGFGISVSAIIGIGTLLPYSTVCHAESSKLLKIWKFCARRERGYVDKMLNGLRPVGFQVGLGGVAYFVLKRSTKSAYYSAISEGTFNILMA